ncbi:MAG TPA: hypothetical protein VFL34_09855 [Candidatus Sulfotelmatobacter sp.]|nr:hypothetical protein [Candidatus Sulfotelmatobacter sp.]
MSGPRGCRGLMVGTILLAQLCMLACSPPAGLQSSNDATQADQHPVPFHDESAKPGLSDSSALPENDSKPETPLPFHDPENLPAGTLLTVRLKNPIFAENLNATGTFDAVVDQAVVVDGNQLLPPGTLVSGRVESARASHLKRNRGYLRLTLESIHLAGSNVPLQTSSLFVGGNAGAVPEPPTQEQSAAASTTVVRLEKGHRLVFRLTEPVYIAAAKQLLPAN